MPKKGARKRDKDPSNDYFDGYNAGRRYNETKEESDMAKDKANDQKGDQSGTSPRGKVEEREQKLQAPNDPSQVGDFEKEEYDATEHMVGSGGDVNLAPNYRDPQVDVDQDDTVQDNDRPQAGKFE